MFLFSFFPSLQSCFFLPSLVLSLSHDCCDKTSSPHESGGNISASTHSPSGHKAPNTTWLSSVLRGLWVMESIKGELNHSQSLERPGDVVSSWRRSLPSAGRWLTLSLGNQAISFRLNYLTSVDPPPPSTKSFDSHNLLSRLPCRLCYSWKCQLQEMKTLEKLKLFSEKNSNKTTDSAVWTGDLWRAELLCKPNISAHLFLCQCLEMLIFVFATK